jgi:hypothetical protein
MATNPNEGPHAGGLAQSARRPGAAAAGVAGHPDGTPAQSGERPAGGRMGGGTSGNPAAGPPQAGAQDGVRPARAGGPPGGGAQAPGRAGVGTTQRGVTGQPEGSPSQAAAGRPRAGAARASGPGLPRGGSAQAGSPGRSWAGPSHAGPSYAGAPEHRPGGPHYHGVGVPGRYERGSGFRGWGHPYSPGIGPRAPWLERGVWGRDRYWRGAGRRWPWFRRGAWGERLIDYPLVTWAQSCLAQILGPWVPRDGIVGPRTRRAIEQFQAQQQLVVNGVLDDSTIGALRATCGGQQEARIDHEGGASDDEIVGDAADPEKRRSQTGRWVRHHDKLILHGA